MPTGSLFEKDVMGRLGRDLPREIPHLFGPRWRNLFSFATHAGPSLMGKVTLQPRRSLSLLSLWTAPNCQMAELHAKLNHLDPKFARFYHFRPVELCLYVVSKESRISIHRQQAHHLTPKTGHGAYRHETR